MTESGSQDEPHVHLFSEDGDCIDLDCGMWRSQYIEQLERDKADLQADLADALDRLSKSINRHNAERDDLLAALEAGVSEADRTHMAFLWHGKIWADEARALITRLKETQHD